jgi:hypothetical protein
MSLLLTGAKTATIAGTPLQCLEFYTGEAYTLPIAFVDDTGTAIDCTGWVLGVTAKWYNCTIVSGANNGTTEDIDISDLVLISPQPSTPGTLVANFTTAASGLGYLFIPTSMSGTTAGTTPTLNNVPSLLAIVSLNVTRTDPLSGYVDINREPIGLIIRYQ